MRVSNQEWQSTLVVKIKTDLIDLTEMIPIRGDMMEGKDKFRLMRGAQCLQSTRVSARQNNFRDLDSKVFKIHEVVSGGKGFFFY